MSSSFVVLESADGEQFRIPRDEKLKSSATIVNLLDAAPEEDEPMIPLQNITADTLKMLLAYPDGEEDDKAFFAELSNEAVFNLILAGNFLEMARPMQGGQQEMVRRLRGKTAQEIGTYLGSTREFTKEDEKRVLRENPWLADL